jgi:fatty acid synthase subunit alpha, fungi type
LWAAEDIDAVFDQDPQRVCILQGPVAVKHSKVKDEPIKDLLGNINSSLIQRLLERKYGGDESKIPTADYLSIPPFPSTPLSGVQITQEKGETVFQFGSQVPDTRTWLETLAGPRLSWLRALVTEGTIVQGNSYIDNPMHRLLAPRPNQKVVVTYDGEHPASVIVYGAARSYGEHDRAFKSVEIQHTASSKQISVTIFEERRGVSVPLPLFFRYVPSMPYAPIHEVSEDRNKRIKEFYWKLWYGDDSTMPDLGIHDTFTGPEVTIQAADVEQFCAVVGNAGESFKTARSENVSAPMDFAIVTGWQVRISSYLVDLFSFSV